MTCCVLTGMLNSTHVIFHIRRVCCWRSHVCVSDMGTMYKSRCNREQPPFPQESVGGWRSSHCFEHWLVIGMASGLIICAPFTLYGMYFPLHSSSSSLSFLLLLSEKNMVRWCWRVRMGRQSQGGNWLVRILLYMTFHSHVICIMPVSVCLLQC